MSEQTARNKPAPAPSWVSRLVRLLVLLVLIGSGAAGYIYVWPEVAAFQAKQAEVEQNLASLAKADQSLANDLTALIDTKVKDERKASRPLLYSRPLRGSRQNWILFAILSSVQQRSLMRRISFCIECRKLIRVLGGVLRPLSIFASQVSAYSSRGMCVAP
jgi:hypothetical protein